MDHGVTTIWESWANVAPDGIVGTYSFNHYTFGCVADWMVRHIGGLSPITPGYEEFCVAPHPVSELRFCRTSYRSVQGIIRVDWERDDAGGIRVEVEVPVGACVHVLLPSGEQVLGLGLHIQR